MPESPMPPLPPAAGHMHKISENAQPSRRRRPVSRWRWVFPAIIRRSPSGLRLTVLWRRLPVAGLIWLFILWFAGSSALYFYVKYRRGFTDARYANLLFLFMPSQRAAYEVERGDFYIAAAKQQLKDQKFREAFTGLRIGVARSPKNREGRLLLSQLYMLIHRPDMAEKTLVEGLDQTEPDQEYLQLLFTFLLQQQEDAETIRIADRILQKLPDRDPLRPLAIMAKATAAFYRGNYDLCEDTIKENHLEGLRDARILNARIDWERGLHDQALSKLRVLSQQNPKDVDIYVQLINYLRQDNRDSEIQQVSLLRQIAHPDEPRPRIDYLYILDKQDDKKRVEQNIEDIFRDFPESSDAMLALADFAANTARPELAERVYNYAKAHKLNWEGPAFLTVEAYVVAKRYAEAIDAKRKLIGDDPEMEKRFASVFNGLLAIANYGLGDTQAAQAFLKDFLALPNIRADNLVAVSNRLIGVGAKEQARQVLAQAVATDPLNQPALVSLIKLDLDLQDPNVLANNVRKLLSMRKPPHYVLRFVYDKLSSDRYLFLTGRTELLANLRHSAISGGDDDEEKTL